MKEKLEQIIKQHSDLLSNEKIGLNLSEAIRFLQSNNKELVVIDELYELNESIAEKAATLTARNDEFIYRTPDDSYATLEISRLSEDRFIFELSQSIQFDGSKLMICREGHHILFDEYLDEVKDTEIIEEIASLTDCTILELPEYLNTHAVEYLYHSIDLSRINTESDVFDQILETFELTDLVLASFALRGLDFHTSSTPLVYNSKINFEVRLDEIV